MVFAVSGCAFIILPSSASNLSLSTFTLIPDRIDITMPKDHRQERLTLKRFRDELSVILVLACCIFGTVNASYLQASLPGEIPGATPVRA